MNTNLSDIDQLIHLEQVEPAKQPKIRELDPWQANDLLVQERDLHVIDLRSVDRLFADGKLPRTYLHKPYHDLLIQDLPRDRHTKLMLVSEDGVEYHDAAARAASLGFDNIFWLRGGFKGWKEQHLDTVSEITRDKRYAFDK